MKRPGPLLWLRYAFGGGLPPAYSPWVLHDTTAPSWLVRHLARVLVMLVVPIAALVALLPTSGYLRALTAFTTGACVVLLMSILASDITERRVFRAGYPWGTGAATRAEHAVSAQARTAQRYRERMARRHRTG
jgi:uncharacterized membrane protein YoaK (UPF0700 family)